ncbi:MAG: hypothetical protein CVU09_14245 [Bacteroidetes bacterium HGW-Bacteroidetes-4]|nr:MAG: hypothetical protein CVU09_14245 [Bacteroidetes bacterium HGW-Bacteroidetes-4]
MKEISKQNNNHKLLKHLQNTAFLLLLPFWSLSQQAEKVWDEFASKRVSMQANPVAFSIEKNNRSMHPLKKEGEYHYLLHYEVNHKDEKVYAQLMYTDLLKGNFISNDTSVQKFAFIYPDAQLNELLKFQLRNPSAIFDTVYNEKSYQAFHADLVRNDELKKASFFVNKKAVQVEFLMIANLNPDQPVASDQPVNIRFSFNQIKGKFMLTESSYHFIEKNKGRLYMKTINYNYIF